MPESAKPVFVGWRKSRQSGNQGDCVEVATTFHGGERVMGMRDSKGNPDTVLVFAAPQWRTFITAVKEGDFDQP